MPRIATIVLAALCVGAFSLSAERLTGLVLQMRSTDARQDQALEELQQQVRDLQAAQAPKPAPNANDDAVHGIAIDGDPSRGPADAWVTVVAFLDYQCPYCGRVQATLKDLQERNPDVRLVVKQNPLAFHQSALPAAVLALCAQRQGSFWAVHDGLYAAQPNLAAFLAHPVGADVDAEELERCRADPSIRDRIARDQAAATRVNATGTPTFFVNGRKLSGAQPYQAFQNAVDRARIEAKASGVDAAHYYEARVLPQP